MTNIKFLSFKHILNVFILFILLTAMSACSKIDKYNDLRNLENKGAFLIHLSNLYEKLSKSQAAKMDWADSSLFSEKSLRAAKGILADPEHPEDWDVRDTVLAELKESRRVLLDTVNGEAIKQKPRLSANAYFMYDCWIEQEENWWQRYIDTCKREFYSTINKLRSVVKDVNQKAEILSINDMKDKTNIKEISGQINDKIEQSKSENTEKGITEEEIVKEVMATIPEIKDDEPQNNALEETKNTEVDTKKLTLYFSLDSYEISGETMLKLQDIVHEITKIKPKIITINGHADRSGKESYNLSLSEKRANAVYKALIEYGEMGIEKNEFEILGFGESYPARKTEDGIKDPANRRVEIILE